MNMFDSKTAPFLPAGVTCTGIKTVQVNLGRMCNLSCRHCHLECSPDRDEMMSESVMDKVLDVVKKTGCELVDITGGAPELHPDLKTFIERLADTGVKIQVRTNFVALSEQEETGIMQFFRCNKVQVVGSLPCYTEENVTSQRGEGVYETSIETIKKLNGLGYGVEPELSLGLVYNPGGPFLPGSQIELEEAYRRELDERFGIVFTNLFVITNMPIGRFGEQLKVDGMMDGYMTTLSESFNEATLDGLMCRHQVCVDWDGTLYDCDFNLASGLSLDHGVSDRLEEFSADDVASRRIVTADHCLACTAGAGSSCSGALEAGTLA